MTRNLIVKVLGIGTLWDFAARSIAGQQYTVDLLHNPMYSFSGDKLYASPGNKPKYSGPAAKGAYKKLLGSSSTVDIPVEDGRDSSGNQRFDLSRGEGIGTVDGKPQRHVKVSKELQICRLQDTGNRPCSAMS